MLRDYNYDIFVCYDETTGKDFASAIHAALTSRRGYKVFVAHIERDVMTGDFRDEDIDPVIEKCNTFIILNTLDTINRPEIIREIKKAFPNGKRDGHDLWVFRENKKDVQKGSPEFTKETKIELERINQPSFSNESELARISLRNCDNKRQLVSPASIPTTISSSVLINMKIDTKFASTTNVKQLVEEFHDAMSSHDYDRALFLTDQILLHEPNNLSIINYQGIVLNILGKHHDATDMFSLALSLYPKNPLLWANKAISLLRENKAEEALRCINNAISLGSEMTEFMQIKAQAFYIMDDIEHSLEWYDKALSKNKNNSSVLSSKGAVLNKIGKTEDAKKALEQAIKINPKNFNALYNLAVIYYQEKKYDESLNYYNTVLTIKPDHVMSLNNRGVILQIQGKHKESSDDFSECIRLEPSFPFPYNNKGLGLSRVEKYQESIEFFDKAIELDAKYIDARINRSVSLSRLERYDEAIDGIKKILEIDEDNFTAWYEMGAICTESKNYVQAEEAFKKVIKLKPDEIKFVLDLFMVYHHQNKYDEGLSLCNEALQKFTSSIPLLIDRSVSLIKLKKYELAIIDCDKIIDLDPTNSSGYYNKACALSLLGKKDVALELLEKSINLNKHFKELASSESDFENIKTDLKFQQLIK